MRQRHPVDACDNLQRALFTNGPRGRHRHRGGRDKPGTVSYTGWLYDASKTDGKGLQFDASTNATFFLTNVIAGWQRGVVGMKVGGQRRLIIPPELAYGSAGSGPIPPNATLVFDIGLLGVQ